MPDTLPGDGFFGWLGRQVGHVAKALKSDTKTTKTLYSAKVVREEPLPDDPNVILRRTLIDEVVVKTDLKPAPKAEE